MPSSNQVQALLVAAECLRLAANILEQVAHEKISPRDMEQAALLVETQASALRDWANMYKRDTGAADA
jgi:hypothetical protein